MKLKGRSVLITGGSSGLGADMAQVFAGNGASVTVSGRDAGRLARIADSHSDVAGVEADVTDPASVKALFEGRTYDIVIANAGIGSSSRFEDTTLEDWNAVISTNLTGVFLTLREGMRQVPANGRLIAISSILGVVGAAYVSAYSAAKHGIIGLVRSAAKEVGETGITVNAVCPGYLDTEMTRRTVANIMKKTGMSRRDAIDALVGGKPDRRLIPPRDVSEMVLWLASDASASVNGQAIVLSGGEH